VTAADVFGWIRDRDERTPSAILDDTGSADAHAALRRLQAAHAYTERQRDGIIGTAKIQLSAYDHPAAARTATRGGMTPEALFDGGSHTLYIVAGREHQQLLAPLVVTMICSLMFWLSEHENRGAPLNPPALFALDETAQIAPLQTSADPIYILEDRGMRGALRVLADKESRETELEPDLVHPIASGPDVERYALKVLRNALIFPYKRDGHAMRLALRAARSPELAADRLRVPARRRAAAERVFYR
jgi:hypothetical protein